MIPLAAWCGLAAWALLQGTAPPGDPADLPSPDAVDRRTPDLELLRVRPSFLEREFRLDYSYEDNIRSTQTRAESDLDVRLAVPVDTTWLIGVLGNYRWLDEDHRPDENGAAVSVFGRVMILQDRESSYAFNLQVTTPDKGVGDDQTQFSAGVAGFEDLEALLGLDRVGLYADLEFLHASARGQVEGGNQLDYVVSLARTWTEEMPGVGRLTTFAELSGSTLLDLGTGGKTTVSITPGIRFDLAPGHALVAGADFPLTHPPGYSQIFRVSYVFTF